MRTRTHTRTFRKNERSARARPRSASSSPLLCRAVLQSTDDLLNSSKRSREWQRRRKTFGCQTTQLGKPLKRAP